MWGRNRASKSNNLDSVLTHLKKISEAPDLTKLEAIADARKIPLEDVLEEERKKKYKAIDARDNSIFIVTNPAAWRVFFRGSELWRERPLPERYEPLRHERVEEEPQFATTPKSTQKAIF